MSRSIIISGQEMLGLISHELETYIGVVAHIADHRPILKALLDEYLYGRPIESDKTVRDMLLEYSVPTLVVDGMVERLMHLMLRQVQFGFGIIYPYRGYHYRLLPSGDAFITETNSPIVPIQRDPELEENDEERGDWIPERARRR